MSPKDPFLPVFLAVQAVSQHEAGHIEEAFETAKRACRMPHGDFRIWAALVATAVTAGRLDDAREAAAKLLEVQPDFSISNWLEHREPNHHPGFQEFMANKLRQAGLPE